MSNGFLFEIHREPIVAAAPRSPRADGGGVRIFTTPSALTRFSLVDSDDVVVNSFTDPRIARLERVGRN